MTLATGSGVDVAEDRVDGTDTVEHDAARVRDAIAELTGWLEDACVPGRVAVAARRLRDEGLAPSLQIDEPLPWVSDGCGGANVPLTALAL
jgi:hypothetical protein